MHNSTPHHSIQQVTTTSGTEESQAHVDYGVYNPNNELLGNSNDVSEAEVSFRSLGGRGPWKICFRVSHGQLLRPSVMIKLTYFLVSYEDHSGESFDWEKHDKDGNSLHHVKAANLGSKDQVDSLEMGLLRLDHYLHNVTNEQRFLYARTVRHLRTAESTLRRTFWYYLALYAVICLASFSQLVIVRMMFRKVCYVNDVA